MSTSTPAIHTINISAPKANRNFNLDLIRVIAFSLIPLIHFFLYTGFYDYNVDSLRMIFCMCLRNLGLLCIPLFMLLTGYLQGNKKISINIKYYTKIFKFIVPHILVILFSIAVFHFYHGKSYTLGSIARELTSFPGYSWYIEMYLGLFLMIPFLNIIWSNLKTKKQELILLGTLILLSLLPSVINTYYIGESNWWLPSSEPSFKIIPDFWTTLYPITHYYAGAYLCKHRDEIKIKPAVSFLLFIGSFLLFSAYNICRNIGVPPSIYAWVGRASFGNFIIVILFFLFITSIKFKHVPSPVAKFTAKLSDLSLGAYLSSYIVDFTLYAKLNYRIPTFEQRLWYLPLMVLIVVASSFVIAFFIDLLSKPIIKLIEAGIQKLTAKKAPTKTEY